jgi:putative FmdB family regulatory protein
MPTYHYRCSDCGHDFEEFQLITEEPLDKCPQCGGEAKRQISGGAGLLFKGNGFYITDYRSAGYKKDAKKDAPPSAKPTPSDKSSKKSSDSSTKASS